MTVSAAARVVPISRGAVAAGDDDVRAVACAASSVSNCRMASR
jgi:hypothetical protein